jgi:polyphenol oxidase
VQNLFKIFDGYSVKSFLSEKKDGSMKLTPDNPEALINRENYLKSIGLNYANAFFIEEQKHGKTVIAATKENLKDKVFADALTTSEKGIILTIRVADCLPVYAYNPRAEKIALIHAGWRGLDQGILAEAIQQMGTPEDILIGIGPCIQSCHFEVKKDVADIFSKYPEAIIMRDHSYFVDLNKVAQIQLMDLGIVPAHIELSEVCTYEQTEKFFSFRRDKPKYADAMLAVFTMI